MTKRFRIPFPNGKQSLGPYASAQSACKQRQNEFDRYGTRNRGIRQSKFQANYDSELPGKVFSINAHSRETSSRHQVLRVGDTTQTGPSIGRAMGQSSPLMGLTINTTRQHPLSDPLRGKGIVRVRCRTFKGCKIQLRRPTLQDQYDDIRLQQKKKKGIKNVYLFTWDENLLQSTHRDIGIPIISYETNSVNQIQQQQNGNCNMENTSNKNNKKQLCGGDKQAIEKMLEFGRQLYSQSIHLRQQFYTPGTKVCLDKNKGISMIKISQVDSTPFVPINLRDINRHRGRRVKCGRIF
ncbi:hypothetical protein WN51_08492 [Melipona quadrifasciata]|uniref:Uncharacterized protein n=1 Tax=Melipona quadrifasciata TaxID=166423 RepID=A0A0M9A9K5_9HYME|nr:hypothetical protein WN51_08492 [Melipona quadrifasciata]